MNTEITPAMTEAQWRAFLAADSMSENEITNIRYYAPGEPWFNSEYQVFHPHAVAAALLYGQPFGFTQRDVDLLEAAKANLESEGFGPDLSPIVAKIRALLPPTP